MRTRALTLAEAVERLTNLGFTSDSTLGSNELTDAEFGKPCYFYHFLPSNNDASLTAIVPDSEHPGVCEVELHMSAPYDGPLNFGALSYGDLSVEIHRVDVVDNSFYHFYHEIDYRKLKAAEKKAFMAALEKLATQRHDYQVCGDGKYVWGTCVYKNGDGEVLHSYETPATQAVTMTIFGDADTFNPMANIL